MHKLSSTLAFITNKIFIALLIITTLVLAQVAAVAQVITNKDNVKNILTEANLYQNLPENAIYVIKLEDSDSNQQNINAKTVYQVLEQNGFISTDDFNKVIVAVVSPDFLQMQTEKLIDGVYDFLDGKNKEIVFSFSLKDRSDIAKNELNNLINNKLANLPVCSYEQLLSQQSQDINILEASCLPPGVSLQSKIDEFTSEITDNNGVFGQEFTQKDAQISTVDANMAKYVYNSLKNMVWIFWLLFISVSAVIILTSKTLHRGLKSVGAIQILIGAFLLIGYLTTVRGIDFVEKVFINGNNLSPKEAEAITNITAPIFNGFMNQVVGNLIVISLVIILIGILLVVLGYFATKHHIEHLYMPKHASNENDKSPITDSKEDITTEPHPVQNESINESSDTRNKTNTLGK